MIPPSTPTEYSRVSSFYRVLQIPRLDTEPSSLFVFRQTYLPAIFRKPEVWEGQKEEELSNYTTVYLTSH